MAKRIFVANYDNIFDLQKKLNAIGEENIIQVTESMAMGSMGTKYHSYTLVYKS